MPAGTMEAAAGSPRSRRPPSLPRGPRHTPCHPVSPGARGARRGWAGLSRRRRWFKVTRVGGDTERRLRGPGQTRLLGDPPGYPHRGLGAQGPPRAAPAAVHQLRP